MKHLRGQMDEEKIEDGHPHADGEAFSRLGESTDKQRVTFRPSKARQLAIREKAFRNPYPFKLTFFFY